jgi:hypothetical protein
MHSIFNDNYYNYFFLPFKRAITEKILKNLTHVKTSTKTFLGKGFITRVYGL